MRSAIFNSPILRHLQAMVDADGRVGAPMQAWNIWRSDRALRGPGQIPRALERCAIGRGDRQRADRRNTRLCAAMRPGRGVAQFRHAQAHGVAAVGWAKSSALLVGRGHLILRQQLRRRDIRKLLAVAVLHDEGRANIFN